VSRGTLSPSLNWRSFEEKPLDRVGIYRLEVAEIPLDKEQRL